MKQSSKILFESKTLNSLQLLQRSLRSKSFNNAKFITLLDSNSYENCFSSLIAAIEPLQESHWIEIDSLEKNKSIQSATEIWQALLELEADKNTVLINLGGGIVSDLGGFVAGTYKRGIRYINIPTTLLGMVDASIGGKTAVNVANIKNQVGLFYQPKYICIFPEFAHTLPEKELKSGLGEILKTFLIADSIFWNEIKQQDFKSIVHEKKYIYQCASIKKRITDNDFFEKGIRKSLNFGHSIGHAFESVSFSNNQKELKHGEAIALGILCELFISHKLLKFPSKDLLEIENFICRNFEGVNYFKSDIEMILSYLYHDKKNAQSQFKMSLLHKIGEPALDIDVSEENVIDSILYLNKLF